MAGRGLPGFPCLHRGCVSGQGVLWYDAGGRGAGSPPALWPRPWRVFLVSAGGPLAASSSSSSSAGSTGQDARGEGPLFSSEKCSPSIRTCHPGAGPPSPAPCRLVALPHPTSVVPGVPCGLSGRAAGSEGAQSVGRIPDSHSFVHSLFVHSFVLCFLSTFSAHRCSSYGKYRGEQNSPQLTVSSITATHN